MDAADERRNLTEWFEYYRRSGRIAERIQGDDELGSVPAFVKSRCQSRLESSAAAPRYEDAFGFALVTEFIEPLADRKHRCYRSSFADLCTKVRKVTVVAEFARRFGLPEEKSDAAVPWLDWARNCSTDPKACLICLASYWTDTAGCSAASRSDAADALELTALSLQRLGAYLLSSTLVLEVLGITREEIGLSEWTTGQTGRGKRWLRAEGLPLFQFSIDPAVQTRLLGHLAYSLRRLEGSGMAQSAAVVEQWLEIAPNDYKRLTPDQLAAKLTQPSLGMEQDVTLQAYVVSTLADSLRYSHANGPFAAWTLLECWLETWERDYEETLSEIASPDVRAAVVSSLAHAMRGTGRLGSQRAASMMEKWLGLCDEHYATFDKLAAVARESPFRDIVDSRIKAETAVALISALSDGRSARDALLAAHVFCELGRPAVRMTPCDAKFADVLEESYLSRIEDPTCVANAIGTLAHISHHASRRGSSPVNGLHVCDQWLAYGFTSWVKGAPEYREFVEHTLKRGKLADVRDPVVLCNIFVTLGNALAASDKHGPEIGCVAIEAWLGINSNDYHDWERLRERIARSPLAAFGSPRVPIAVIDTIATLCMSRTVSRTISNSELQQLASECAQDLRRMFARREQAKNTRWSSAGLFEFPRILSNGKTLAQHDQEQAHNKLSFGRLTEGQQEAFNLIEAWLGCPVRAFATAERLAGASANDKLAVVQTWLASVGEQHADAITVCEQVADYVKMVRSDELSSVASIRAFAGAVRGIWIVMRDITLARAQSARDAGDVQKAVDWEWKLMAWTDEFENRLLEVEYQFGCGRDRRDKEFTRILADKFQLESALERLSAENNDSTRNSTLHKMWRAGTWGLAVPWVRRELRELSAQGFKEWMSSYAEPQDGARCGGVCPLGRVDETTRQAEAAVGARSLFEAIHGLTADAARQGWDAERSSAIYFERQAGFNRLRSPHNPSHIAFDWSVPQGCIWIRALFDRDERLCWWAWRNESRTMTLLASGVSEAGALSRLNTANREFDAKAEAVWNSYQKYQRAGFELPPRGLRSLTEQIQRCIHGESAELLDSEDLRHFETGIGTQLESLSREWPSLALRGRNLLNWLLKSPERRGQCPQEDWADWNEDLEQRRKNELDAVSRQQVQALNSEWKIAALWEKQDAERWKETDILFQVQGPLLVMPLAWLDFSARPLFERVASTSMAVSMSLRREAANRSAGDVIPQRKMLSTAWDKPENRIRAIGLPLLHAGIHHLAQQFGWEAWSLGDDPQATVPHLRDALRNQYGVVVIGGHGRVRRDRYGIRVGGVELASEELWDGSDSDLSDVDLLILASCTVGRLDQHVGRDVEGLYARLAAQGARCVVAARWPVADQEAAAFLLEFLRVYLKQVAERGSVRDFDRARAFNQARRTVIDQKSREMDASFHLASAFEMYGLG